MLSLRNRFGTMQPRSKGHQDGFGRGFDSVDGNQAAIDHYNSCWFANLATRT